MKAKDEKALREICPLGNEAGRTWVFSVHTLSHSNDYLVYV